MQKLSAALNHNKIYFYGLLSILFAALLFLFFNGKEASFISLNSYHPFYLNVFFINYTFIGDGIFALCLIALMFFYFKRNKCGFALLYSFLISGLAAQIIKNLVNSPRPKLYFEAGTYLNFIDGVTHSGSNSFPSGHAATAFAIATVLVLMMKNKNLQLLILMAAALVGYSRIYLAQHFLPDVIIGALLGTASGIISFYLVQNRGTIKQSMKNIYRVPSDSVSSLGSMQTA
jgi:membrane-associated phospholipid phosphatase